MIRKVIVFVMTITMSLSMSACSSFTSKNKKIVLKKGISLTLTDVWKISNSDANTVYYYYLATIKNKTKKNYSIHNLSYTVTDEDGKQIHSIDSSNKTPFSMVYKNESAYVYGYIGYPKKEYKNIGLRFGKKRFISFDSVDVRESSDEQIQKKGSGFFSVFSSDPLDIQIDTKDAVDSFQNGTTTLSHVYVTYKNKTNHPLVIPYLVPHARLNGINLSQYSDKGNFSSMTIKELRKIDFSKNGMPPKTMNIDGQSSGYVVYYLRPKQEIQCDIASVFQNAAIDYSDTDKRVFLIDFESAPFGSRTQVKISRTSK